MKSIQELPSVYLLFLGLAMITLGIIAGGDIATEMNRLSQFLFRRAVKGFKIEPAFRGNCVLAQLEMASDPILYCSADITQVEDALRRYRQMPLGDNIREKRK